MIYDEFNRPSFNFMTGKFLKGRTPHNKGKKMEEYIAPENIVKIKEALDRGRRNPNRTCKAAGWNKRKVVYLDKNNTPRVFSSSEAVARLINAPGSNVRQVCDGKRKLVHGKRFYWWDEDEWVVEMNRRNAE